MNFNLHPSPETKKIFIVFIVIILTVTVVLFWTEEIDNSFNNENELFLSRIETKLDDIISDSEYDYDEDSCDYIFGNVAKIKIYNAIDIEKTYDENHFETTLSSEEIASQINKIGNNDDFQAILLSIDSPGGYMVPAEEIVNAVKRSEKPVVAVIKSIGASAAYLVASSADYIFASKGSDVGSIGVTMSYTDNYQKNLKEGITYNNISSGKFKDTGDENKQLTAEEQQLFMRDVLKMHDMFVQMVSEYRNLPLEKVKSLADGSTVMGEDALKNGLIDAIGGEYEAGLWLKDKIGTKAVLCNYN